MRRPARVCLQEELFGPEEYRQVVAYHYGKARFGLQLPLFDEDESMRSERGPQRKAPADHPQASGLAWDDWRVTQTYGRGLIGPPICRPTPRPHPASAARP